MTDQEILKLIKRATSFEKSQEVKRSSEDLVGQVLGCYKIGYNDISGALFYRDSNNIWQPVKLGNTGGGGVVVPVNLQQVTDVGSSTTNNIEIRDNVNQKIGLYKADGIRWDYGDSYQILNPQNVGGQYNELLLPRYNGTENPSNLPRVLGQTINNLPFDIMGNIDIVIPSPVSNNFANADLTATGNRVHDFNNNDLQVKKLSKLEFKGIPGPGKIYGVQFSNYTTIYIDKILYPNISLLNDGSVKVNMTGNFYGLGVGTFDMVTDYTSLLDTADSFGFHVLLPPGGYTETLNYVSYFGLEQMTFSIDLPKEASKPLTILGFDINGNGGKYSLPKLNPQRLGIEDNLGVQNRAIDFDNYKFEISKLSKLFIGSGIYNGTGNTVGEFVYDFDASTYGIDMQVYSGDFLD